MVTWQVTATTIYCDLVDDEVTIMVYKDWSVKCTGHKKYGDVNLPKKRRKQSNRKLECKGLECNSIVQYKEKLLSEEPKKDEHSG